MFCYQQPFETEKDFFFLNKIEFEFRKEKHTPYHDRCSIEFYMQNRQYISPFCDEIQTSIDATLQSMISKVRMVR